MKLDLKEMEASELCDVVHFFFEQDARYGSAEEVQSVSDMRSRLYSLYDQTYKYAARSSGAQGRQYIDPSQEFDLDEPSPTAKPPKNYIPPTEAKGESLAPFGALLDPPIGG